MTAVEPRLDPRAVERLRRRVADRVPQPPRRSVLRDSLPPPDPDAPPPEVTGALAPLPDGGPWEGGTVDRDGRRWTHIPWVGWRLNRQRPFLPPPGRVYTSAAVRQNLRRERRVRLLATPGLVIAAALVCTGLLDMAPLVAFVGLLIAAVVLVWAWPRRGGPR